MFQSYEYINHIDTDIKSKLQNYEYKIIDSDWIAVNVISLLDYQVPVGVEIAVILEYEKRNLSVGRNLYVCIQYIAENYGYSLNQLIRWNKQINPYFSKYEKEIQKYLIFS